MRKLYIAALLVFVILQSCKKSGSNPSGGSVQGTWTWVATYADNPAYDQTPANTGIKQSLVYNGNNWSFTRNDSLIVSGSYSISTVHTNGYTASQITVKPNSTPSGSYSGDGYYQVKNDTLTFSSYFVGAIGGGSVQYVKK